MGTTLLTRTSGVWLGFQCSSPPSSALPSTESCNTVTPKLKSRQGLEDKLPLPDGIQRSHGEHYLLRHTKVVNRATSIDAALVTTTAQSHRSPLFNNLQRQKAACWSWIQLIHHLQRYTVKRFDHSLKDCARKQLQTHSGAKVITSHYSHENI